MNFISAFGDEINYLVKYPCADSAGSGLFMGKFILFIVDGYTYIYMDMYGLWMASITKVAENVSNNEETEVI